VEQLWREGDVTVLGALALMHVDHASLELRQQARLAARRVLGAFARATALQSGDHVLAQWCHQTSPCVT